jgi:NitT/TauT family transport system permease protein
MQAIPVVAVAPVLSLWFGVGVVSKIAMAALLCWFPMVVNAIRGFEATTTEQKLLFTIYGTSRTQLFFKLQLPQSVRFLLSGARTSAGLAMIGAIVAEYTGANAGLGYVITQSTYRLDTPELFAAILLAALAGLTLSWALGVVERSFLQRYLRA